MIRESVMRTLCGAAYEYRELCSPEAWEARYEPADDELILWLAAEVAAVEVGS